MDLATIKHHLYVEHDLDDNLITQYADAAETVISSYLHSNYDETNKAHEQAKLLLVGSWYTFRENESTLSLSQLPTGIKFILDMEMSVAI